MEKARRAEAMPLQELVFGEIDVEAGTRGRVDRYKNLLFARGGVAKTGGRFDFDLMRRAAPSMAGRKLDGSNFVIARSEVPKSSGAGIEVVGIGQCLAGAVGGFAKLDKQSSTVVGFFEREGKRGLAGSRHGLVSKKAFVFRPWLAVGRINFPGRIAGCFERPSRREKFGFFSLGFVGQAVFVFQVGDAGGKGRGGDRR